ncbi:MAG: YfhO family protein [Acidobacteria bacterium]|nr:YfhO family protein [Acidobacteriota bacterium]
MFPNKGNQGQSLWLPKAKRTRSATTPSAALPAPWWTRPGWIAAACFALAVLVFYWIPLTDPNTTPQWDTVDYHYSVQKYFSGELQEWRLPAWSDFAFSGYPFLADPQTGAWYPLNWPFFLAGITPKALMGEIALHALLALMGAWLLAKQWLRNPFAAAVAAVCYAFSGYFAGHATHLGMYQAAAWLPLLLYGLHRSIEEGKPRTMALTGIAAACMFLVGHFQTALYSFAAMAIYGAVVGWLLRRWRPVLAALAIAAGLTTLLSAIQLAPTAELAFHSTRAGVRYVNQTDAPLVSRALWTLVSPNHYGSVAGAYTGPPDITEFYFYGGSLLLPLALIGLLHARLRWVALALLAPALWYAYGPAAGFYRLIASLPGFGAVRAPVHIWFLIALALSLSAAAGVSILSRPPRLRYLGVLIALITFADVFYWNSLANQMPYFRASFEARYGQFQEPFLRAVRKVLPAGTRFHAAAASPGFGPMNNSYDQSMRATYGSNPLRLERYERYLQAASGNRSLVDGLNAGARLVPETGEIVRNPEALPRFYFPPALVPASKAPALDQLARLNPASASMVEGTVAGFQQDAGGRAEVKEAAPAGYVLETSAATPSLLRAAIPWYPGWTASVDGHSVGVRIVDHALMGIPVPAGRHEVRLKYVPASFYAGAFLSLAAATGLAVLLLRRKRPQLSSSTTT